MNSAVEFVFNAMTRATCKASCCMIVEVSDSDNTGNSSLFIQDQVFMFLSVRLLFIDDAFKNAEFKDFIDLTNI